MSILAVFPNLFKLSDEAYWSARQQHVQGILDGWLGEFEANRQIVSVYVLTSPDDIARRTKALREIPNQRLAIASLRKELADIAASAACGLCR